MGFDFCLGFCFVCVCVCVKVRVFFCIGKNTGGLKKTGCWVRNMHFQCFFHFLRRVGP